MTGGAAQRAARLEALRERGAEAVAPLWLGELAAEEGLAEARRYQGPVFRLQEAELLLALSRRREAADVLAGLRDLPSGLAAVREALLASAGEEPAPAPGQRLETWLGRVRRWRRAEGV